MKFYMIHLMPYADLDLDYDKKLQLGLGDAAEHLLRSARRASALQPLSSTNSSMPTSSASTASAATSITRTPTG